jgi:hypothetical protein
MLQLAQVQFFEVADLALKLRKLKHAPYKYVETSAGSA